LKNKKNKILIITECFYPEEFKINDLALSWKEKGYDISVLTLSPSYPLGIIFKGYKNNLLSRDKYKGINIYRIFSVTGYKSSVCKKILRYLVFALLGSFVAIFIGKKYDYIFGYNMSSLTNMVPAVIIRKLFNKPLMLWVQDIWPDNVYAYGVKRTKIFSSALDIIVKFIYSNVDKFAISGKGFKHKIASYSMKDTTFLYSPNWADELDESLPKINLEASKQTTHFTFAGNIGKVQNLENIIKGFNLLSKGYQNKAQLNIIGDGSNLNNIRLIANKNPNITFHGKKLRSMIARYYKSSDFLIISLIDKPIFSLTVPAKTQTYIAAKKPILAIINGETAKIIKDNKLGLCASPSNIQAISNLFKKCVDMNDTDRKSYIKQNDRLEKTIFNKEKIINNLLNTLVGKKK
jgi:glycosyltransferase involved in cell wall biosynthesis